MLVTPSAVLEVKGKYVDACPSPTQAPARCCEWVLPLSPFTARETEQSSLSRAPHRRLVFPPGRGRWQAQGEPWRL